MFAALFVVSVREALRRGPLLVIDKDALQDLRSGLTVHWNDVDAMSVRKRQGRFDEYHELVVEPIAPGPTPGAAIELPLDGLSLRWDQIVPLLAQASGKVITRPPDGNAATPRRHRPVGDGLSVGSLSPSASLPRCPRSPS